MSDIYAAALQLHAAGLCVLPAAEDGTKRPAVSWKDYQHERPTTDELAAWFGLGDRHGLGVIAGAVSGGVEMTELEGQAMDAGAITKLIAAAEDAGETQLWGLFTGGWMVRSPSGGVHLIYRITDHPVPGNTKIAATAEHKTLAETRGEGGWFVTAPSSGAVHPTGKPYLTVTGGPATIPVVTWDERERFHALVRATLDERPAPEPATTPVFTGLSRPGGTDGVSPGDDWSARTSWAEILGDDGWRQAFHRGEVTHWVRPGKDRGISATTGYQGDWLYVFTSSTVLEPERTYTRFGYLAAYRYGGDHHAAALDLKANGYGKTATVHTLPVRPAPPAEATGTDGVPVQAPELASVQAMPQAFGLTDVGNARLFVALHGHHLRYVPERGTWLVWGDGRWTVDETGAHVELAKDLLEAQARATDNETVSKHYLRSCSRRGVESMIALARTDASIAVSIERLDAVPDRLCTPGGVVDLRTAALLGSDPADLHTRCTLVTPDDQQQTPLWDAFLATTFGADADLIGYVQRLAGYSATGDVGAHVLPFLYGPSGQNGKSVLLEVIGKLLAGYADVAPGSFLTQGQAQHETEIARLQGVRFVACSETEPGARFAEAKVKMLTGGDRIRARFMRRDHFGFDPTAKLWLMANDRPAVDSGGTSFWRRLRLLEFRHRVPDDQRIDGLARLIVEGEGPGVLAWIVRGARAYYDAGLQTPAGVKASTDEYAADEDHLGRFIAERLVFTDDGRDEHLLPTPMVTAAYQRWCSDEGVDAVTAQKFARELRSRHGVTSYRSNGRRFYRGVQLAGDTTFTALTPNPIY